MLRTCRWFSLGALAIAGAVGGVIVFVVFVLLLGLLLESSGEVDPRGLAWGAILGASVAYMFSLIAGVNNLREKRDAA